MNRIKMNWWEYWIGHCWFVGWQSMRSSFRNWRDLMTGNYDGYALMFYDDPYEECYNCFWSYLGEDETLSKDFLEHLKQMVDDIDSGRVKPVPFTKKMFDELDDLVGDVEVDLNERLD